VCALSSLFFPYLRRWALLSLVLPRLQRKLLVGDCQRTDVRGFVKGRGGG
jgi:hypothetical protein